MKLCVDKDNLIVEWVRQRVPNVSSFGKCTALGIVGEDGKSMAGAVYHDYRPDYKTIMISLAADDPRWATQSNIRSFLAYPFEQLKVHKLRAAIAHTNDRSLKLTEGVGFTKEGVLRDEFGPGIHAAMFRMLAKDFFKQYGGGREQRQQFAA